MDQLMEEGNRNNDKDATSSNERHENKVRPNEGHLAGTRSDLSRDSSYRASYNRSSAETGTSFLPVSFSSQPQSNSEVRNGGSRFDSSDDEPEILLVVQPPTPKRQKLKNDTNLPPPAASSLVNKKCESLDNEIGETVGEEKKETEKKTDSRSATTDSPQYSCQTSAYVQNLAEICYTILYDRRWRVGANNARLLEWGRGDDLSAVHHICQLYLPEQRKSEVQQKRERCRCLLCRSNKEKQPLLDEIQSQSNAQGKGLPVSIENVKGTAGELDEMADDDVRALHLYCRLFYRKGPWFRLDDLYARYYAPKNERIRDGSTLSSSSESSNDSANDATASTEFFLPKKAGRKSPSVIDVEIDDEVYEAVALLCRDVSRLHSLGMIRSFCSEEECGKTVGEVSGDGKWAFFTAEERRTILSKLGGGSKTSATHQSKRTPSMPDKGGGNMSRRNENLVWRQMRRQHSIVGQISKNEDRRVLLPVRRHVNELLYQKLAAKAVLSSNSDNKKSASIIRERVTEARTAILRRIEDDHIGLDMCIRLREAPLLSLRRFTRLYLCASHGPGNMRGDGSNGWMSLKDPLALHKDVPMQNFVSPPGSHRWHSISYPALMHRFGMNTCAFANSFQTLPMIDGSSHQFGQEEHIYRGLRTSDMERVFTNHSDFLIWELCAEIRANVDYLIEVNDLTHYHARRQARQGNEACGDDNNSGVTNESSRPPEMSPASNLSMSCHVDFLDLLTTAGRLDMLRSLMVWCDHDERVSDFADVISEVQKKVESDVLALGVTVKVANESPSGTTILPTAVSGLCTEDVASCFKNEYEMILGVVAVVSMHVLSFRHRRVSPLDVSLRVARPWLRHLWWDGNLAYVLWDCIPVLEKRGYYGLASRALEVLLFGSFKDQQTIEVSVPGEAIRQNIMPPSAPYAALLISRRARGKAFERLVIDYTHILRTRSKEVKPKHAKGRRAEKQTQKKVTPNHVAAVVCNEILKSVVSKGSIPFSAIRSLAKRLKRPLDEILVGERCMEALDLGIRLDNPIRWGERELSTDEKTKTRGYEDWTPVTDYAVANSIEGETSELGKRCSYVGFEDENSAPANPASLNVEELAMEFYRTGRLGPVGPSEPRGGWVGWHDEGGHLRALFRILCSSSLLGVDGGCSNQTMSAMMAIENATVFLTPYQGAPGDLHVGHAIMNGTSNTEDGQDNGEVFVRGFYRRHQARITEFLSLLERLGKEELVDLVYESVAERSRFLGTRADKDPALQRDFQMIRTLSVLAAGFGGKLLSAMFRCLLFDYRHYSGGLPDLLLVRALYDVEEAHNDEESALSNRLVDLGEWVGEGFFRERQEEKEMSKVASFLVDQDEEFLGCSKVGDSGAGQSSGRWGGGKRRRAMQHRDSSQEDESGKFSTSNLPEKLSLLHGNRKVDVQCMFVEVKSSNDRLDPRQEDWLNILDRFGNARVCKVGSGKKKTRKSAINKK